MCCRHRLSMNRLSSSSSFSSSICWLGFEAEDEQEDDRVHGPNACGTKRKRAFHESTTAKSFSGAELAMSVRCLASFPGGLLESTRLLFRGIRAFSFAVRCRPLALARVWRGIP